MINKKSIAVIVSLSLVLGIGLIIDKGFDSFGARNVESSPLVNNVVINDNLELPDGASAVDGIVGDTSASLFEMKKNSDVIVTGTVINQEQMNELVILSTVEVEQQFKGAREHSTVIIHQFASETLELNKKYFLFLGKQGGAQENSYYVKGGHQGDLLVENNQVTSHDLTINSDLKKILNNVSPSSTQESDKQDSNYSKLISWLKE